MTLRQTELHDAEDVLQFVMTVPCAFSDLVHCRVHLHYIKYIYINNSCIFSQTPKEVFNHEESQNLSQVKHVRTEIE